MRPRLRLLVAPAILLALAACGGGGGGDGDAEGAGDAGGGGPVSAEPAPAPTTTALGAGDGTFTVSREVLTDPGRPTGDRPGRELPTDVYVPGGEGPFPLIVHAHGLDGSSAKFSGLLSGWARAGYVVVAPNFPLTNDGAPAPRQVGDYVEQPADVSFVLDEVLALTAPGGLLEGKVADDRIGVSGLSLGGASTYPLLFHPCCRDERFRSAMLMSALELPFDGGDYDWTRRFPTLVFSGTADTSVSYDLQRSTVQKLVGPLWFVTLEGGTHAAPFEDATSPHDELVAATTAAFWDATLRDDEGARPQVEASATVPGLSSVAVLP